MAYETAGRIWDYNQQISFGGAAEAYARSLGPNVVPPGYANSPGGTSGTGAAPAVPSIAAQSGFDQYGNPNGQYVAPTGANANVLPNAVSGATLHPDTSATNRAMWL